MKPNNYFTTSLSLSKTIFQLQRTKIKRRSKVLHDQQNSPEHPVYMKPRKSAQQFYKHKHKQEPHCLQFGQPVANIYEDRPTTPSNKTISSRQFTPLLDKGRLIRARGRLKHAKISYSQKHPVILDSKNNITQLIIEQTHNDCRQLGTQFVQAHLLHDFIIIGRFLKKINKTCFIFRQ